MSDKNYLLSYDIGSTAIKLILFDQELNPVYQAQKAVKNYEAAGFQYQKAEDWWQLIKELTLEMLKESEIKAAAINAITSTGQMEDCLLLDDQGEPLTEVLLYSDSRAKKEFQFLVDKYSQAKLNQMTANQFDPLMSVNKYLWLQENRPEAFAKHQYLILGAKDYLNFKLTGKNITDYTNASTTGFLDIKEMELNQSFISDLNFDKEILPKLKAAETVIGSLKESAAAELNLKAGIKVVNGSGDVGASTLGAGALKIGDIYSYLGTTAWLAMPSDSISENKNLFSLSSTDGENYIIAGAILNAGQAYDWFLKKMLDYKELNNQVYAEVENKLAALDTKENQSIFIPYLNGERSPLKVNGSNGLFARIGSATDSWQLLAAVLEGVAFSLKHNLLEMTGSSNLFNSERQINLIGGGSKSKIWPQLLANILQCELNVLDLEVAAPSLGAAMLAQKALNKIASYQELRANFKVVKSYRAQAEYEAHYQAKFEDYLQLVESIF
ncbi:FGGY-family carbohydrate kinase [Halanaerobium sp. Z-7514]|uniref:FGGY-family carbohydrate kinase n=1 Tax=Halanaerobium polyolivorans TaxID=2886943 RepID=A0AAW4X1J6_9FIRM|nr:FGGY-family carbohydrate kinase [Halanaerobium polyolivorans]MCC3145704.1 FGGY-family carbohydrate kinase [Halanaerobium polyolivorans]RQD77879.1 MAG: hypothetical protein D5S01_02145 [Halanaerobium sp. MSAO_Bac5]